MFQKLNILLNFIILLTVLLLETCALAQENKEIEQFQQSILKQIHLNDKAADTKYSSTQDESSKTLTKVKAVAPSPTTSYNISSSRQNSPYSDAGKTHEHLTNKERLQLERLDRVNTLQKSLGKTRPQNNRTTYNDPNNPMLPKVDPPKSPSYYP